MTQDYSAEFIYRPPIDLQSEFGSSTPIRFLEESTPIVKDALVIDLKKKENVCIDCEAQSHWIILQKINLDNPNIDFIDSIKKIKDALIFVLENTDWPVGD